MRKVYKNVKRYLKNVPGWRTNRKIIVIESDDWGSIRMPSKEVYNKCLRAGYKVDQNAYERYDSLASEGDLELLFDLLSSFKDQQSNSPVITANVLVANPDFGKIRNSEFEKYHYELITKTFKKYPSHANCFKLWNEAKREGLFYPQSHGREHLNVSQYMSDLRKGDKDLHFCFENAIMGSVSENKYVEALHYFNAEDKQEKLSIVVEGLNLFKKLFGYNSESFIPNNYLWSPDFDKTIAENGVQIYQGNRRMKEIQLDGSAKYHTYYLGQKNDYGQKYLIRNAIFEPSLHNLNISDPVDRCLSDISAAFRMKKPAIICSHRINYVGFIDESNRDKNLKQLKRLLKEITKKWPETEFLNSAQLGTLIT